MIVQLRGGPAEGFGDLVLRAMGENQERHLLKPEGVSADCCPFHLPGGANRVNLSQPCQTSNVARSVDTSLTEDRSQSRIPLTRRSCQKTL